MSSRGGLRQLCVSRIWVIAIVRFNSTIYYPYQQTHTPYPNELPDFDASITLTSTNVDKILHQLSTHRFADHHRMKLRLARAYLG
jgi:hypothetical protein